MLLPDYPRREDGSMLIDLTPLDDGQERDEECPQSASLRLPLKVSAEVWSEWRLRCFDLGPFWNETWRSRGLGPGRNAVVKMRIPASRLHEGVYVHYATTVSRPPNRLQGREGTMLVGENQWRSLEESRWETVEYFLRRGYYAAMCLCPLNDATVTSVRALGYQVAALMTMGDGAAGTELDNLALEATLATGAS